jgi:hypothetical protein
VSLKAKMPERIANYQQEFRERSFSKKIKKNEGN